MTAEEVLEDDGGGDGGEHAGEDRVPDAAVYRDVMEHRVQPAAHERQRAEPQDQHLRDRVARREREQHREREEHGEPCEHGAARPRVLEVDVGQHRAEHPGHGHGDQVLRRDDVGGEREGGERPRDHRADADVRSEVGHGPQRPSCQAAPRGRLQRDAAPAATPSHQIRGRRGSARMGKCCGPARGPAVPRPRRRRSRRRTSTAGPRRGGHRR